MKLKIEKGEKDCLQHELREEIQELLTSSIINNNNNNPKSHARLRCVPRIWSYSDHKVIWRSRKRGTLLESTVNHTRERPIIIRRRIASENKTWEEVEKLVHKIKRWKCIKIYYVHEGTQRIK